MRYIKTYEEKMNIKCPSYGHIFNYLSTPESGMGYVKCPKCNKPVTQKNLVEGIRDEYPGMFVPRNAEDLPQEVPGFEGGTIDPDDDYSYKSDDEDIPMTDKERYEKFLEVTRKRNIQETDDEIIINLKRLGEDFCMTVYSPTRYLRDFLNKELKGKYVSKGHINLRGDEDTPNPGFIEKVSVTYDDFTAFVEFELKDQKKDELDFCESKITIDKFKSTVNKYNL
jgi:hypothetical protein